MYESYTLSRYLDSGDADHGTSFTITDRDPINCAHMLASAFNTMSRNFMLTFVLAVVDTEDGRVFYDGKIEQIKRDDPTRGERADPGPNNGYTEPFKFERSEMRSVTADALQMLEESYAELQATRRALADVDIYVDKPSDGVRAMARRLDHEYHARTNMERQYASENTSAVDEMVQYVRAAHVKRERVDPHHDREGLTQRWAGMLDVLAKFLVVTGEADADEGHAAARRLCGIEEVETDEF